MKILVIGRGVAALGFLDKLVRSDLFAQDHIELTWVSAGEGYPSCSLNSTALVALQGIKQGLSPLGDLLNKSYFTARDFLEAERPNGVYKVERYHKSPVEKLNHRFGHLFNVQEHNLFKWPINDCVKESAYIIHPSDFLSWWQELITKSFNSNSKYVNDLITELGPQVATGVKGKYPFDLCIDASGSLGLKLGLKKSGTEALGHYLVFNNVFFDDKEINKSFVLTTGGQNFIYQHEYRSVVFGGTDEKDEVHCPKSSALNLALKETLEDFAFLKFRGEKKVVSGSRHRAPRRMPQVIKEGRVIHIMGLYKNGYTVGHEFGEQVLCDVQAYYDATFATR